MIEYSTGRFGVGLAFRVPGSVIPKALLWAVPNGLFAVLLHFLRNHPDGVDGKYLRNSMFSVEGSDGLYAGYTFILGFLIVFRNSQAYGRLWEGANELATVRARWLNAVSSCIAFCDSPTEKQQALKVQSFQHLLAKLSSMLFCSALQQICELGDDRLEVLSADGIGSDELMYLANAPDRVELLMQWLQQHIMEGTRNGVLVAPAPIVSRVFQELSTGMAGLSKVSNIKEVPFPFPYSQTLVLMLLAHWMFTPFLASQNFSSPMYAGLLSMGVNLANWSLYYIALELDQPFGLDANDLPVKSFMQAFNTTLISFLDPRALRPPVYSHFHDASLCAESVEGPDCLGRSVTRMLADRQVITEQPEFSNAVAPGAAEEASDEEEDLLPVTSLHSLATCFGELGVSKPASPTASGTAPRPTRSTKAGRASQIYRRGRGSVRISVLDPPLPTEGAKSSTGQHRDDSGRQQGDLPSERSELSTDLAHPIASEREVDRGLPLESPSQNKRTEERVELVEVVQARSASRGLASPAPEGSIASIQHGASNKDHVNYFTSNA
eukprot:gb/GFBE01021724.1/.p1 GENE.gb/GFBE01021724.1/~~gb/GFBE01021724.1/.p1  ORF type:complete len:552 (+),score=55.95 gb/GFBE01021724.1/:1-1656(+)